MKAVAVIGVTVSVNDSLTLLGLYHSQPLSRKRHKELCQLLWQTFHLVDNGVLLTEDILYRLICMGIEVDAVGADPILIELLKK